MASYVFQLQYDVGNPMNNIAISYFYSEPPPASLAHSESAKKASRLLCSTSPIEEYALSLGLTQGTGN